MCGCLLRASQEMRLVVTEYFSLPNPLTVEPPNESPDALCAKHGRCGSSRQAIPDGARASFSARRRLAAACRRSAASCAAFCRSAAASRAAAAAAASQPACASVRAATCTSYAVMSPMFKQCASTDCKPFWAA